MRIIEYVCGCISLRAPGQADGVLIQMCAEAPDPNGWHRLTVADVMSFDGLTEIERCNYGFLIHKLILQGHRFKTIQRFIRDEL